MSRRTLLAKWRLLEMINSDPGLVGSDKLIGFRLLWHCNSASGQCNPSYATLADGAGVDLSTAKRAVKRLVGRGWFRRTDRAGGRGHSNGYRPAFDHVETVARVPPFNAEEPEETVAPTLPFDDGERVAPAPLKGGAHAPERVAPMPPEHMKGTYERTDSVVSIGATQFKTFWRTYPSRSPHSNPKKPAAQKFSAAVKGGADPKDIIAGAERYAEHVSRERIDPRYVKQATTWLNQACWEEQHDAPRREPTEAEIAG